MWLGLGFYKIFLFKICKNNVFNHPVSNRYIYLYTLGHHEDASWTRLTCFLYDFLSVTVPQMFHTASNWLTLGRNNILYIILPPLLIPALAVQRYIYVCHAAVAKQWCTLARSRLFVFLVLGCAVTYMLPRVLDRTYTVIQGRDDNHPQIIIILQTLVLLVVTEMSVLFISPPGLSRLSTFTSFPSGGEHTNNIIRETKH